MLEHNGFAQFRMFGHKNCEESGVMRNIPYNTVIPRLLHLKPPKRRLGTNRLPINVIIVQAQLEALFSMC